MFSCKFVAYFQTTFSEKHLLVAAFDGFILIGVKLSIVFCKLADHYRYFFLDILDLHKSSRSYKTWCFLKTFTFYVLPNIAIFLITSCQIYQISMKHVLEKIFLINLFLQGFLCLFLHDLLSFLQWEEGVTKVNPVLKSTTFVLEISNFVEINENN